MPIQNTAITTRFHAPEGWITMKINDQDVVNHLCPGCANEFWTFFRPNGHSAT